jgi:hypothetical protein
MPGATWCGQCFAATSGGAGTPAAATPRNPPVWQGPSVPAPVALRAMRTTRWAKTDTTFGPLGRVTATLALLVPLVVMLVGGMADPFAWGGAAVWGVVIMPWGLRDVWKAGRFASA